MAELTVEEKLETLKKYCKAHICTNCLFEKTCWAAHETSTPLTPYITNDKISTMYSSLLQYMNGGSTMNEHETQTTLEATTDGTIVITRTEYAYLIAESAKNDLLKDYVNSREYLDKDVVRAILGMYRSEESEG